MDVQEAREKFGTVSENANGDEVWQAERPKLRGLLLAWARNVDSIEGDTQHPEAQYYIDDFWEWTQNKMGEGFSGVFQDGGMSPSGRFDRVAKEPMENLADSMYGDNEEFTENLDEVWKETTIDSDSQGEGIDNGFAVLNHRGLELVQQFYPPEPDSDNKRKQAKGSPDPDRFKHFVKVYVNENEAFPNESGNPTAERLFEKWVLWLDGNVDTNHNCIVDTDGVFDDGLFNVVGPDDVIGWIRELWKDDDDFREELKRKWGLKNGDEEQEEEKSGLSGRARSGTLLKDSKKRGQTDIGEWSQG